MSGFSFSLLALLFVCCVHANTCSTAVVVTANSWRNGTTVGAGATSFSTCIGSTTPDYWFRFQPTVTDTYIVSLSVPSTTFDARLGLFTACNCNPTNYVCDESGGYPPRPRFAYPMTAGTNYNIQIG